MDKKASAYEYMFLPDYIESTFDHATIVDSISKPLVKEKIITYEAKPEESDFSWLHPWIVFGFILTIGAALTYYDFKRKKLLDLKTP